MALENWYSAGTVSVESGSTTVTATGAFWGADTIMPGDLFCDPAQPLVPPQRVKEVTGNSELELWAPWPGDAIEDGEYEIRYVGIIERSTAQTRKVLEQLGEVSAYYDVQVDALADRDAYDARPSGYRVLVSDIGDGRAAIYSKASSVEGDWTDPAYFSGPQGEQGDVGPIGVNWRGAWSSGTTFAANDGALNNGSSWRSLQDGNLNHAPPTLPTTSNAWWALIAAKGQDGTGTGDMVGPASSTDNRIAVFDGTTGKLVKDGGKTISELVPGDDSVTNAILANMATKTIKGRASSGTGDPEDLTPEEARDVLDLKWEAIALETVTSVAAWSRTNLGDYRFLRLKFKIRPVTNGAYINVRTSINNGSSYDAGATDYSTINLIGHGAAASSGQSAGEPALTLNGGGNTAPAAAVQSVELSDFNKATYCFLESKGSSLDNSGGKAVDLRNGFRAQSTARNAIQVSFNTGNIADGWFFLEGVRG